MRYATLAVVAVVALLCAAAAPATKPMVQPKLLLKDGAPAAVKQWFQDLPRLGAEYKATEHNRLVDSIAQQVSRRAAIQSSIAIAEAELKGIRNRPVGMVDDERSVVGQGRKTDAAALSAKNEAYKAKRAEIQAAKKALNDFDKQPGGTPIDLAKRDLKVFDNSTEPGEVLLWKAGREMSVIRDLKVGAWGTLGTGMKVSQVVDNNSLIVRIQGSKVWLSGFDTSAVVDDQDIVYDKPIIISKTKRYTSVMGSSVTCLYAEPFPVYQFVTLDEGGGK